ncbi:unnamed protein product [Lepidochelys kempii]
MQQQLLQRVALVNTHISAEELGHGDVAASPDGKSQSLVCENVQNSCLRSSRRSEDTWRTHLSEYTPIYDSTKHSCGKETCSQKLNGGGGFEGDVNMWKGLAFSGSLLALL